MSISDILKLDDETRQRLFGFYLEAISTIMLRNRITLPTTLEDWTENIKFELTLSEAVPEEDLDAVVSWGYTLMQGIKI